MFDVTEADAPLHLDPHALGLLRAARDQLLRGRSGEEASRVLTNVGDHWRGASLKDWVDNMFEDRPPAELVGLPDVRMSRTDLRAHLRVTADPGPALAAILAWGGTGYRRRPQITRTWPQWTMAFADLRGKPAREQYEGYSSRTANRTLRGIGPAFFTKAIFFTAPPEAGGYILDQWTGRSANALTNDRNFVRLSAQESITQPDGALRPKGFVVAAANDADRYVRFNRLVNTVGNALDCSGEHAELLMFSKATWWRSYVALRGNETRTAETP